MKEKVKLIGFYNYSGKWCAAYKRAGRKSLARLGITATAGVKHLQDEQFEVQGKVWGAWTEYLQTEADNPRPSSCPFKTWNQVVEKYLESCAGLS